MNVEAMGRKLEFTLVDESPCRRACPAGIDAKRYVGQIASGDFEGALATIRKHMPFPSACGRICPHPCQTECTRREIDEPIAIMALKRFAIDSEIRKGVSAPLPRKQRSTGKRIAIIGAGPSGLTAAHDLALMGHDITVFEKNDKPGGMLTHAVPEFELPLKTTIRDISRIQDLGVKIECGQKIDGETGLRKLLKQGFDAVLLAAGSAGRWNGFDGKGWIPGSYLTDVIGASEFASRYRAGVPDSANKLSGNVVILGSGVQALACARIAARLGFSKVQWIIPHTIDQLQPDPGRVEQASEERVEIIELTRPLAIEGKNGKVTGIRCVALELDEPDHTGRQNVKPVDGGERLIACETVIDAAYFAPDESWGQLSTGPWGVVNVDLDSMATSMDGVFAAGDIVSGPKTVVEAVALGHRAAEGIHRYLSGDETRIGTLSTPLLVYGWEIENPAQPPAGCYRPGVREADARVKDFEDAEVGFTAWEAQHEAQRCLLCGPCEECAVCLPGCGRKKGTMTDSDGNPVFIRVPTGLAQGLMSEVRDVDTMGLKLFTAVVDPNRCRACGVCEEICDYHAPRVSPDNTGRFVASIDILACKGCGTCVAACPSGAIDQAGSSLHAIHDSILEGIR
jgi:NADPH-dependent glutamate synthase beta subunit-like oxidoreductase/NAD-dependent dihydropyrimidine dehydrogenase PreA subunit